MKIILDLCGGTGSWSAPYRESGYDVRLVTLPDDVRLFIPPANVYGILAAPPCTQFSYARSNAKTPRDFLGALSVVDACLRIITICRPTFWALENPWGYLKKFIGSPKMVFHPCDYGDPYQKKTALWGEFVPPMKTPVALTEEQKRNAYSNSRPIKIKGTGLKPADIRAITPAGFAKAFFEANR